MRSSPLPLPHLQRLVPTWVLTVSLVALTVPWTPPAAASVSFRTGEAQETTRRQPRTRLNRRLLAQSVLGIGDTAIFELQDGNIVKGRLLDKLPDGYLIRLIADDTTRVLKYEEVAAMHVIERAAAQPDRLLAGVADQHQVAGTVDAE